ncbi:MULTISPECIES: 4'-phosphopantetheinyl transferase family protein [unclassified Streptomyces]|uniref:4'-phosphopantetheinyl transferase family protein n=1 Tax=unclassified Streptomyces TaxID=2593676 RepID=UPI0036FB5A24
MNGTAVRPAPPRALRPRRRLLTEAAPGVWVALADGCPPRGHLTEGDLADAAALPPHRAAERLAARRALRGLLAARFPEARDAEVVYSAHGRPALAGRPEIGISVSHDGDAVAACAARGHAVGLDVQHPPRSVADALLRRCAHRRADALTRLPQRLRAREFAWLWTVQEACVKAAGTGLAGRPWAIDVPLPATHGTWGPYHWISLRGRTTVPLSIAHTALPDPTRVPETP